VTYDATGQAQELPYRYVPQAFREWGAVPKDWHTQCSTLAGDSGMLTKLKRLYPIVGELPVASMHVVAKRCDGV
jgi:hypothetical protein